MDYLSYGIPWCSIINLLLQCIPCRHCFIPVFDVYRVCRCHLYLSIRSHQLLLCQSWRLLLRRLTILFIFVRDFVACDFVACKNTVFFGVFPMFVPSLSCR